MPEAVGAFAALVLAGGVHQVVQRNRRFQVSHIEIMQGDTIQFVNKDPFEHQIYIDSPTLQFESPLQPPDKVISVTFPHAGDFHVMCHVHPTMDLDVTVK